MSGFLFLIFFFGCAVVASMVLLFLGGLSLFCFLSYSLRGILRNLGQIFFFIRVCLYFTWGFMGNPWESAGCC